MYRIDVKRRVFEYLITLSIFVFVASLLALAIAEDPVERPQEQKPRPMLSVVSPSSSVR
jgi:hypothetical protein